MRAFLAAPVLYALFGLAALYAANSAPLLAP